MVSLWVIVVACLVSYVLGMAVEYGIQRDERLKRETGK